MSKYHSDYMEKYTEILTHNILTLGDAVNAAGGDASTVLATIEFAQFMYTLATNNIVLTAEYRKPIK